MINNITLCGRITHSLDLKKTNTGLSILNFDLAVQRDKENADFIPCVAFKGTAEYINQYSKGKGGLIIVNGRLQTNKYQDKNGNNRTSFDVLVNNAQIIDYNGQNKPKTVEELQESVINKAKSNNENTGGSVAFSRIGTVAIDDDDLPF